MILSEVEKQGLGKVYGEIELPLISIAEKMRDRGIAVDRGVLETLSKTYHKELTKIEKKIYSHAGGEFNINSPKQLGEVLFDKLALVVKGQK